MAETTPSPTIKEITSNMSKDQVLTSNIPIDIYIIEAENLHNYASKDQDELIARGLDKKVITNLPNSIAFLQDCQSGWMVKYNGSEITLEQWNEESKGAYDLQRKLQHDFRFAYRNSPKILTQVNRIAEGSGHADMVQDLSDYAAIGKANPEPLKAILFDATYLDKAESFSHSTRILLGKVNGIRTETDKPEKDLRDRAYSYLKQSVDEIRDFGKYVFWEDEDKVKHYSSAYQRKIREQNKKQAVAE